MQKTNIWQIVVLADTLRTKWEREERLKSALHGVQKKRHAPSIMASGWKTTIFLISLG